jgi:hypothetical protein
MRHLHGLKRTQRDALAADAHIDAAAIIARSLNRVPIPAPPPREDTVAEPPTPEDEQVTEPLPVLRDDAVEEGVIIRISSHAPRGEDVLVDELVSLGMSVIYDLNSGGPARWDEIVIELPPEHDPVLRASCAGTSAHFAASAHTRGTLDVICAELDDVDPGCGYDVLVRRSEIALCRWPSRASDVRDPEPPAATTMPVAEVVAAVPAKGKRRSRFRRTS